MLPSLFVSPRFPVLLVDVVVVVAADNDAENNDTTDETVKNHVPSRPAGFLVVGFGCVFGSYTNSQLR